MPATRARPVKRVKIPTHYPETGRATTVEARQFLRVGKTKFFAMLNKGMFPRIYEGRQVFIDWSDLWAHHRKSKLGANPS